MFLAAHVQDDRLVVLVRGDGDHARLAVVPVHGHGGVPPVLEPDQGGRPPPYLLKYFYVIIFLCYYPTAHLVPRAGQLLHPGPGPGHRQRASSLHQPDIIIIVQGKYFSIFLRFLYLISAGAGPGSAVLAPVISTFIIPSHPSSILNYTNIEFIKRTAENSPRTFLNAKHRDLTTAAGGIATNINIQYKVPLAVQREVHMTERVRGSVIGNVLLCQLN